MTLTIKAIEAAKPKEKGYKLADARKAGHYFQSDNERWLVPGILGVW